MQEYWEVCWLLRSLDCSLFTDNSIFHILPHNFHNFAPSHSIITKNEISIFLWYFCHRMCTNINFWLKYRRYKIIFLVSHIQISHNFFTHFEVEYLYTENRYDHRFSTICKFIQFSATNFFSLFYSVQKIFHRA